MCVFASLCINKLIMIDISRTSSLLFKNGNDPTKIIKGHFESHIMKHLPWRSTGFQRTGLCLPYLLKTNNQQKQAPTLSGSTSANGGEAQCPQNNYSSDLNHGNLKDRGRESDLLQKWRKESPHETVYRNQKGLVPPMGAPPLTSVDF